MAGANGGKEIHAFLAARRLALCLYFCPLKGQKMTTGRHHAGCEDVVTYAGSHVGAEGAAKHTCGAQSHLLP